jgi:hypothetical protein
VFPPITENFGDQDASAAEHFLPANPSFTWISKPGFTGDGWCTLFPNEYIIEH